MRLMTWAALENYIFYISFYTAWSESRPDMLNLNRFTAQKSGVCAVGTAALVPKNCGCSAQIDSGQSPITRR